MHSAFEGGEIVRREAYDSTVLGVAQDRFGWTEVDRGRRHPLDDDAAVPGQAASDASRPVAAVPIAAESPGRDSWSRRMRASPGGGRGKICGACTLYAR